MKRIDVNTEALDIVRSLAGKGREPHSILICGERGSGKKTLAKDIAKILLCENGCGVGCNECRVCRLIEKEAFPDVMTLQAPETGNIKVDEVRAIVSQASQTPTEGRFRVFILADLDRSVQTLIQIQNILLKLIEEPPDHAVMILTARSKELFLDTVVSRTLQLRTETPEPAQTAAFLIESGFERYDAEQAVSRCGGNIGNCLEYLNDKQIRENADSALKAMEALAASNEPELLKELTLITGKKNGFINTMKFMQRIVRDAQRIRAKLPVQYPFSQKLCQKLGEKFGDIRLVEIYETAGEYSKRAEANCQLAVLENALAAQLFDRR